jgi:CubicO group peptidase (beta-lactamase class C family)
MDPARLEALLGAAPERIPYLTGLLVIRRGEVVLEEYFNGNGPEQRHEVFSVTKSFIATLVGIAINRGDIAGVDSRIFDYYPGREYEVPARIAGMTVEEVLTMTTGLDWTEGDAAYEDLYTSRNWGQFMLDLPLREPPGSRFNYCTGCSHLLAVLVEEATGMDLLDFAHQALFDPIGISDPVWLEDSQGTPIGGWGLQLTPHEMARLGYLYLREGRWGDRQVVSQEWVAAATSTHIQAEDQLGYGYQWWVRPSIDGYAAVGRGGQMIAVVPEKELVVVFTSEAGGSEEEFALIEEYVLPAVR